MDFCVYISLFSVVDNTVTLFNCFFRGFRDFRDFPVFRVFDLANCRDSFSSCSEHIDVWSESGSKLEEEIFEEQSKDVIFVFEPVGCLGETDISRSPTNTDGSSDFHRLNELEW